MSIFSDELMTKVAHIIILAGVVAAYLKSKRVEGLIETQKEVINTLQKGFDACKENLKQLEKTVNSRIKKS